MMFEAENRELMELVNQLFDTFFGDIEFDYDDDGNAIDVFVYHD